VLRSADLGATWTRIESNLPPRSPVMALVEDPVNPAVLFAGTQFGVHATTDGGARWFPLQLNLPTVPVHDLVIHPREHDLVIGTHGRGIWILDSIGGLRGLTPAALSASGAIFTPRPAMQIARWERGRSSWGDAYYAAPNPPDGAILDVYVNPRASGPVWLEVFDRSGARVRRFDLPNARGLHRVVWDMRAELAGAGAGRGGDPAAGQPGRGGGAGRGALVPPGTYDARLTVGSETFRTDVVIKPDPLAPTFPRGSR